MQSLKMSTLILILICLSSCNRNNAPKINDQEQLSPILADAVEIDGEMYIPVKESYCLSRKYRINKGYIGPVGRVLDLDIYECQKIIGRAPSEYGVFVTWMENVRVWLLKFK